MIVDNYRTLLLAVFVIFLSFMLNAGQPFDDYVEEIEISFAEQMAKEFNLHWKGNSGVMRGKVEEMGMQFSTNRKATIEEARALQLLVMDKFVQAINAHEKIQPYLAQRPFTYEWVTISISFNGPTGRNSDGTVSYVFNVSDTARTSSRNHIIYRSNDPFKDNGNKLLSEHYEEAVKLNQKASVDPTKHLPNAYEEELDALLSNFVDEVQEQYGLYVWAIGGNLTHGIESIGATFYVYQLVTQEEGRQLITEVADKLLTALNNNEKLRPYLKEYPFPASLLKLKLEFKESRYFTFPNVRLIKIILDDNKITYTQEVVHPAEKEDSFPTSEDVILGTETYQEAQKIAQQNPDKFKPKFPTFFDYLKDWLYRALIRIIYFFSFFT